MCGVGAIDWCGFTCEAFATLFAGTAAVGGATWIGWRQTKIQDRLADLQAQSLKFDLYDRRFKIYEAARDFIMVRMANKGDKNTIDKRFAFAVQESQFIFDQKVYPKLSKIFADGTDLDRLRMIAESPDVNSLEPFNKFSEAQTKLWYELNNIQEIFSAIRIDDPAKK